MIRVRRMVKYKNPSAGFRDNEVFFYVDEDLLNSLNDDRLHGGSKKGSLSKYYVTANDVVDFVLESLDFYSYTGTQVIIDYKFVQKYFDGIFVVDVPSKHGSRVSISSNIVRSYEFNENSYAEVARAASTFGEMYVPKSEV